MAVLMIWLCLCLTWLWWMYLGTHSHMILAQDALGYEALGRKIAQEGFFPQYFISGPNREPVYPLMVAFAMRLEFWFQISYQHILIILGYIILGCNQLCCLRILQLLHVRPAFTAMALLYLGFSPAINNAALSLYSEISVFPFISALVLLTYYYIQAIKDNHRVRSIFLSVTFSLIFIYLTFAKAPFEIIAPIYIMTLALLLWRAYPQHIKLIILCALTSLGLFTLYIHAYKNLNHQYNGHYALTNRAAWALYGNTARRMEPLNTTRLLSALAYVPGEGFCKMLYTSKDCDFWSFKESDALGMQYLSTLQQSSLDPQSISQQFLKESAKKALSKPLQYGFLTILEGFKMFFWESTQIGFVNYPSWLNMLYQHQLFKNFLRCLMGLITLTAVILLWVQCFQRKTELYVRMMGLTIFLFISLYAFFFILTRYAIPIAPLFIISIAYTANILYNKHYEKN